MASALRRVSKDHSQALRRAVQCVFLVLNVWIGIQFWRFVRFYESGGRTRWADRPPGIEGWLPIAALMNLKAALTTGRLPRTHAAGMFLLLAFVAISLLFRKAFCSWLCPIGTVSEALWKLGRRVLRRSTRLPHWADLALRSVKYVLLGLFLFAVGSMSAMAIADFLGGPYGAIADVKMLNFFRYLGTAGVIVLAFLVAGSMVVQNFWCRYFCPYGALLGLVSLASPLRIRRERERCIDCSKCGKACPSGLPVDSLVTIHSAECTACLECVAACPIEGALMAAAPGHRSVPAWVLAAGVAVVFLTFVFAAQWTGHWRTDLPANTYFELIPHAQEFSHP